MSIRSSLKYTLPLTLLVALLAAATLYSADRRPAVKLNPTLPLNHGLIALPRGEGKKPRDDGNRGGPIVRIPGGGITVKPKPSGILDAGPVVVDPAGPLTLAPATLQVLNENNQWSTQRKFIAVKTFHFRWSRSEPKVASARWELGQMNLYQAPGPADNHHPHSPQGVLIATGQLPVPPAGQKSEFTIDFTKYLPAATPVALSKFNVAIALFDAAGNRLGVKSNDVTLFRLAPELKVASYQRYKGNFDANEPPVDAFIRANIVNHGAMNYEGGGTFEFYAKKAGSAPKLLRTGQLPAIAAGQTSSVFATRPVDDWDKTDASSQYTYECKLMP